MIKSELVQRISSQNPHLYQRDIEKIVSGRNYRSFASRRPSGATRFRSVFG
jgi:hypothetical protein